VLIRSVHQAKMHTIVVTGLQAEIVHLAHREAVCKN